MQKLLEEGKELCIYCRGDYGLRTYFELRDLHIPVSCFADADSRKRGYVLGGVSCISYDEFLQKDRENTIVLVCKMNSEGLMEIFRSEGFLHVYSYQAVEELREEYPQITLDNETIQKINMFREALYQIMNGSCENISWVPGEDGFSSDLNRVLQDATERRRMCKYGAAEDCRNKL